MVAILVDRLVSIGHRVIVLDNFVSGKRSNISHHNKKNVKIIKIDVSSKNLDKYFKKADYIFHYLLLLKLYQALKIQKNTLRIML